MKQPTVVRIIGRFCGMFALSLLALGLVAWALVGQPGAVQGHSDGASSHTRPGAVQTSLTGGQARTLFYQVVPTYLTKEFVGDPVPAGSPVALRFTITNFDRFTAMTGIAFTDDLASTLPGLVAAGLPATNLCGTGSAMSGTSLLSFSGGMLEPEATCTFTVTLQVPALTAAGAYTNTTGALTADLGGPVSFGVATDILLVNDAPFLAKRFSDDPVTAGAQVTLEFAITNTSSFSATDIGFSDNLNAVLAGLTAVTLPAPGFCGAASTLSGASMLTMNSGELAPNASCFFSVTLQVPANALGGAFANVTGAITAMVNGESRQGNAATDTLTVVSSPVLTKNFMNDPVAVGGVVILEFVLTHGDEAAVAANIAFSDDLAATLPGLVATGLPRTDLCGAGSQLSGGSTVSFTGGSLAPGSSCTVTVTLQVPVTATAGIYANTTSTVTADVLGMAVAGSPATDSLRIIELAASKLFLDGPAVAGGKLALQFTLSNTSQISATANISFTDNLAAALAGLASTSGTLADICGAGSSLGGTTLLTFSGGTLPPASACTFTVTLAVPAAAANGEYLNRTGSVDFTVEGIPAAANPAEDAFAVVPALALAKAFLDDPVMPGGAVTLAFTITNVDSSRPITDIAFSDDLGAVQAGLQAIAWPAGGFCGAGSQLAGASTLAFTGGTLAPGASCTFTATIQAPPAVAANSAVNTTSAVTGLIDGAAVTGDAAQDTLTFQTALLTKRFTPGAVAGQTVLTFTLQNLAAGSDFYSLSFVDDLSAMLAGATATDLPKSDVCGAGSTFLGNTALSLNYGTLAAGAGCTFSVTVQIPGGAAPGIYTNTTSVIYENGQVVGAQAEATLTVASPAFAKQFAPATILVGGVSTLTFTIDNSVNVLSAAGLIFTDTLPVGLVIAAPANAVTSCSGGTLAAAPGAGAVSYAGGAVAASSTCTVTVAVTGAAGGIYTNTTGSLASSLGNSAEASATLVVALCAATPDDGATVFSSVNAQAVQSAIDAAGAGDTVKVVGRCTGVENAGGSDQTGYITTALTLRGGYTLGGWATSDPLAHPTTLDAALGGRVLRIDGVPVEVANLTVQHGQVAGDGGGIFSTGALTLTNVQVLSSTAAAAGGGAYVAGAVAATDSRFAANRAGAEGGGLFALATSTVVSSQFVSNTAVGNGGGAYLEGGASMVNSTIAQNRSGASGGGFANAGGAVTIIAGTVASNTADADGGGIFNTGGGSAVTVTAGSLVQANSAQFGGGVANDNAARFTLSAASMIRANVAISYGGGIINGGAGLITIDASTLIANHAVQGGALQNNYPGSAVTIANGALLQNNLATAYGGAIFNGFGSTVAIDASSLLSNTAAQGGGLHNQDEGSVVTIAAASRLQANAGTGEDSVGGAISNVLSGTVVITGSTLLLANQADFGGALYVTAGGTVAVNASHIQANTAITSGGGIYNNDTGRVAIERSLLEGNTAQQGYGGAVRNFGQVTVGSSRLLSNTAPNGLGGAITTGDGVGSALAVSHSTLQHNSAGAGGALYQLGGISTVTANCIVDNSDTAVIYAAGASPLAATGNWWGHPSGPAGAGPGVGDSVSSNVDFSGFTTAAILGCPTSGNAELAIVKTASPALAVPGQNVTYVLTFGNSGQRFAHNVVISDSVPVSVTITGVASSGAVISQTGGSPNFVWLAGDLAIGSGGAITLTGTVNNNIAVAGTVFTNTATIAGAGDVTLANNTARAGVTVKPAFTVGGAVSGLVGSGLVLQNNGGDNLAPAADGPFTFATPLLDGSAYTVSVLVQPANPPQICVVNNGGGVLAGTHASNVLVVCTTGSYLLTTVTDGTGSGALSLDPAGGTYSHGAVVTVTAIPAAGSAFAGWSGACSGTGGCVVTMDAAKIVTATFDLLLPSFDVSIERRNNDPVLPGDTVLWDVTITNTGPITATVNEISATLTVVPPPLVAAGGGEPAPCAPPVTLAVAEIHRCTLSLLIPGGGAVELTLTVSGEGANGAPVNTTVTAGLTLVPPTGLEAVEEPIVGPKLFLPLIGR